MAKIEKELKKLIGEFLEEKKISVTSAGGVYPEPKIDLLSFYHWLEAKENN